MVQLVELAVSVKAWQKARHEALIKREASLPKLKLYVDLPADSLVFLTHLALGALAAYIFRGQVVGATAAIAVGASAPALLKQLGGFQQLAGLRALHEENDMGIAMETVPAKGRAHVPSVPAEEG